MIAVTGAAMVFSTFNGASIGFSRSLPSGVRTKTLRRGETLALVGPILARSSAWRSSSSATGRGCHSQGGLVDPAIPDDGLLGFAESRGCLHDVPRPNDCPAAWRATRRALRARCSATSGCLHPSHQSAKL